MKKWNEELWLLTPKEYEELRDGVMLKCIDGEIVKKGVDHIDQDVRFGCIAFGLTKEMVAEQNLNHEFLIMLLKS